MTLFECLAFLTISYSAVHTVSLAVLVAGKYSVRGSYIYQVIVGFFELTNCKVILFTSF